MYGLKKTSKAIRDYFKGSMEKENGHYYTILSLSLGALPCLPLSVSIPVCLSDSCSQPVLPAVRRV